MNPSGDRRTPLETIFGGTLTDGLEPLFGAVGGGASVGVALMCAWESRHSAPQWDRAAGLGAAGGAVFGSLVLLYDTLNAW